MNGIHQNGKATFTAGGPLAKGEFVKLADGKVTGTVVSAEEDK